MIPKKENKSCDYEHIYKDVIEYLGFKKDFFEVNFSNIDDRFDRQEQDNKEIKEQTKKINVRVKVLESIDEKNRGIQEGIEIGKQKGIKEGIEEGIEEGQQIIIKKIMKYSAWFIGTLVPILLGVWYIIEKLK